MKNCFLTFEHHGLIKKVFSLTFKNEKNFKFCDGICTLMDDIEKSYKMIEGLRQHIFLHQKFRTPQKRFLLGKKTSIAYAIYFQKNKCDGNGVATGCWP